jgi:hypothetical protein
MLVLDLEVRFNAETRLVRKSAHFTAIILAAVVIQIKRISNGTFAFHFTRTPISKA